MADKFGCDNCGEMFASDYPRQLATWLALRGSYPTCEVSMPQAPTYCPACQAEITRLQQLLRSQQIAAGKWMVGEIKRFGMDRRRQRTMEGGKDA